MADTAKWLRSSIRSDFLVGGGEETPFAREATRGEVGRGEVGRGEDGRGEDGRLSEPVASNEDDGCRSDEGTGSADAGAATAVSTPRINWYGSCTAASRMRLTVCCKEAGTSAWLHCSSSTSLADRLIRDWWNACKNDLAYPSKSVYVLLGVSVNTLTWLTTAPRRPTIIRLQVTSQRTTKLQHSLNTSTNSRRSSLTCCSARVERTLEVNTFADSAAEKRVSNKESCIAVSSDGSPGGL